jgi:hypothetical protein
MGGSTVLQNNAHYLVMQWARVKVTLVLEKAQHGIKIKIPAVLIWRAGNLSLEERVPEMTWGENLIMRISILWPRRLWAVGEPIEYGKYGYSNKNLSFGSRRAKYRFCF